MVNDPYKVLGVSRDASPDEIKKAYRAMARKYHPDMHPDDPNATAKMNEINEAYDMLTNPAKYERAQARSGYGSSGSSGYGGTSGGYGSGAGSGYSSGSSGGYGSGSGYSSGRSGYSSGGYDDGYGQGYSSGYNSGSGNRYGWYGNFYDFFGNYGSRSYGGAEASVNPKQQPGDSQSVSQAIQYINAGQYQQALQILGSITSSNRNARWYYLCALAYYGAGDMTHATDFMRRATEMDPTNGTYESLLSQFMGASRAESASESTTYYSTRRTAKGAILRLLLPLILFILFNLVFMGGGCFGCFGCNGCLGNRYNRSSYTQEAENNNNSNNNRDDEYYDDYYGYGYYPFWFF